MLSLHTYYCIVCKLLIVMALFLILHGIKRANQLAATGLLVLGAGVGSQSSPIVSPQSLGGCMNWKRFFAAVFALLVVLSLGSTRVSAQTQSTGDIAGVVTDARVRWFLARKSS